jgi:hypothetical protein
MQSVLPALPLTSCGLQSSLSPVRRGGVGEQSKVSKVKIDVSSGFAVPLGHQTPLREPLFPETRIPVPTYAVVCFPFR